MGDKKNATWSMRISDKLHADVSRIPAKPYEEMQEKIEDIMMQYAFLFNNDYKKPYKGNE